MKKIIKLPAPQLSQLKEVNIDLDMTGRHFAQIATSDGQVPEDVALSILKDLVVEDANKLTMSEMRYLFMLVKINSLENDYTIIVSCTHEKNGKVCNHANQLKIKLSDADLNPTPKNYKVPEITFVANNTEKEYYVLPPTMDMESAIYNWFINKGKSLEDIANDKQTAINYTFIRACCSLVDKKTNQRLVQNLNDFDTVLTYFDCNKYQTVHKLYEELAEVDSFGVQNKIYEIKCKECGGKLIFRLPLLNGLSD